MSRTIIFLLIILAIDLYAWQAIKAAFRNNPKRLRIAKAVFRLTIILAAGAVLYLSIAGRNEQNRIVRSFVLTGLLGIYLSKLFIVFFLVADDLIRLVKWVKQKLSPPPPQQKKGGITRSQFLARSGIIMATLPLATMSYGIVKGAHDYRIRRERIILPGLPKQFHGIRIAQLSDIHSGSFVNKRAVEGGVEMLMREKPDVFFFTGDLVNSEAKEMNEYLPVFGKIKADLGAYSVLGNHDYGEYKKWPTDAAKHKNLQRLKQIQAQMGWKLLLNENDKISLKGEALAIAGVENWGRADWSQKYGNLKKALSGTEDTAVKLLLSHDPSHWEAEVQDTAVDITFSGHTHGFQFGVELGGIKWSPVQYFYKHWAGLYKEQAQYLYVNRGFGYIGFPGRVGILPEITIFELVRE